MENKNLRSTYVINEQDRINSQDLITIYSNTSLSGNINGTPIENISVNNFDCYQSYPSQILYHLKISN